MLGRADDDDNKDSDNKGSSDTTIALANTGITGKRVLVVGGGMAGMTAAKYLRLWGGPGVQVTLVDPDTVYTSNIMSNLVLNGSRTVTSLQFTRDALTSRYGVARQAASLDAIDVAAHVVLLSDGSRLGYDRLVLAPGVSFDDACGLTPDDYDTRTPDAWRAGPQTTLLREQIAAMANGDVFVMTIPKMPYRCPPGPYERACLVADCLKKAKGPDCRVFVLDENLSIQAERHTFERAFTRLHAGVVVYEPGATGIEVDAGSRVVRYVGAVGALQVLQGEGREPDRPAPGRRERRRRLDGARGPEQWPRRPLGRRRHAQLRVDGRAGQRHPRARRRRRHRHAEGRARGQPGGQDLRRRDRARLPRPGAGPGLGGQLGVLLAGDGQHGVLADGGVPVRRRGRDDEGGVARRPDVGRRRTRHGDRVGVDSSDNFEDMGTWFKTLMLDTAG